MWVEGMFTAGRRVGIKRLKGPWEKGSEGLSKMGVGHGETKESW